MLKDLNVPPLSELLAAVSVDSSTPNGDYPALSGGNTGTSARKLNANMNLSLKMP